MLGLSLTARQSNKTVSELLGIEDEQIAFAVNHEAAEIFYFWEREQEQKVVEAMLGGGMAKQATDAVAEVTAANFRDKSW